MFYLTFSSDLYILSLADDISAFEPIAETMFPLGMLSVFILPTLYTVEISPFSPTEN